MTNKITVIRTNFPRFQEYFEVIIQYQTLANLDPSSTATKAKMYVGKYFTVKGEFDQVRKLISKHGYKTFFGFKLF